MKSSRSRPDHENQATRSEDGQAQDDQRQEAQAQDGSQEPAENGFGQGQAQEETEVKNITGIFSYTRLVTTNGRMIGSYLTYAPYRFMRIRRR